MRKVNWWIVGVVIVFISLFLFGGGMTLASGASAGVGSYGMMGGYGMMHRGLSPFDWFGMGLGMVFMWFVPIGIVALIGYGAMTLARNTGMNTSAASLAPCPNCGKGTQADWQNCPYCGKALN